MSVIVIISFCCLCLCASGQLLEFIREHPTNEHFWEVKNENEEIGYVPTSYLIVKEQNVSVTSVINLEYDVALGKREYSLFYIALVLFLVV